MLKETFDSVGYMKTSSRTATAPKRGFVQEGEILTFHSLMFSKIVNSKPVMNHLCWLVNTVRREWLVHEDGAFALQLQDEESKLISIDFFLL